MDIALNTLSQHEKNSPDKMRFHIPELIDHGIYLFYFLLRSASFFAGISNQPLVIGHDIGNIIRSEIKVMVLYRINEQFMNVVGKGM